MGTTADKLRNIAEAKADIGAALAERGVAVPERLSEYGQAVRRVGEATITYLDWDDTILGTQAVPKGVDIRRQVNNYVREHFIHPDVRAVTDPLSIARTDNYRGEYPHMGPQPEGTTEGTVANGADYPLTDKLDYVFFKRPLVKVLETQEDGTQVWKGAYASRTDENGKPVADVAHPFAYGWAVVDPAAPEETWTVMGAGWLKGYSVDAAGVSTFTHEKLGDRFLFADFESGVTGDVVVKAVYDEGFDLLGTASKHTLKNLYPAKKTSNGSNSAVAYSLHLTYSRAYTSTRDGLCYGIAIASSPRLRIDERYDVRPLGVSSKERMRYRQGDQILQKSNGDISAVIDLDPKQGEVDAMLMGQVDKFPFVSAVARSDYLKCDIPDWPLRNFTYLDGVDPTSDQRGTDGYVLRCTLQDFARRAKDYINGTGNKFFQHYNADTATDAGLRAGNGEIYTNFNFSTNTGLEAYRLAWERGWLDQWGEPYLTPHQLQHYICTKELLTAEEAEKKTFWWCKLHDHCLEAGKENAITTFVELLQATLDGANGTNPKALTKLTGTFDLRTGKEGVKYVGYAGLDAFRADIAAAIQALKAEEVSDADILAMSWKQTQYLLDNPGSTNIPGAVTEDYWWENGGKKAIPDLPTLLTVAYDIKEKGYDPSWLDALSFTQVKDLPLRKDAIGRPFSNVGFMDAFRDVLYGNVAENALDKLLAGGYDSTSIGTVPLMELQHALIAGTTYRTEADLKADPNISYYWITGAPEIADLKILLRCAWLVYEEGLPEDELLGKLDVMTSRKLHLRQDVKGNVFGGVYNFKQTLKTAMAALKAEGFTLEDMSKPHEDGGVSWAAFQNVLLGNAYEADPDASGFWWKDGGYLTITTYPDLLIAAWLAYGIAPEDPAALDGLTDLDMVNGVTGTPDESKFFLRADEEGTPFVSLDDFKAEVKAVVIRMKSWSNSFFEGLKWVEFQHLLLGNPYQSEANIEYEGFDYWWENGGTKPTTVDGDREVALLLRRVTSAYFEYGEGHTEDSIKKRLCSVADMLFLKKPDDTYYDATDSAIDELYAKVTAIVDTVGETWDSDLVDKDDMYVELTWNELQNYLLNGTLISEEAGCPSFDWKPVREQATSEEVL